MILYLLRHGEAGFAEKDFLKPLTLEGELQLKSLLNKLPEISSNTEVWCSAAKRTRRTFELIDTRYHFNNVKFDESLYLCSKEHYLDLFASSNKKGDLLIVGHNFGISQLASYFAGEHLELSTGEFIAFDFGDLQRTEISQNTGIILHHLR